MRPARGPAFDVTEGNATLGKIVGRQLQRDLVAREDADVMLAHLACTVGDQIVTVFQDDAIARIGKDFVHHAVHFNEFFFSHVRSVCMKNKRPCASRACRGRPHGLPWA